MPSETLCVEERADICSCIKTAIKCSEKIVMNVFETLTRVSLETSFYSASVLGIHADLGQP